MNHVVSEVKFPADFHDHSLIEIESLTLDLVNDRMIFPGIDQLDFAQLPQSKHTHVGRAERTLTVVDDLNGF